MKDPVKILVVDDEPMIRSMARDFLEAENFEVVEASNGRDAFELIKKTRFKLVISDVRMPGGDGEELILNVNSLIGIRPMIILMTGFSDLSESKAHELGVISIFQKPFLPEDLVDLVKSLVTMPDLEY